MTDNPSWQPIAVETTDDLVAAPIRRLAALLDHDAAHWPADALPPLAHWLYFLPEDAQSRIGADGHPERGAMLPPIAAPRRMWAGGRLTFHRALPLGAVATRRSIVTSADHKHGRSGSLDFVTVRHEVRVAGDLAITEEQDLVFRQANGGTPPPAIPDVRASQFDRTLTADATALFRFSALTFNAHRIHYDRDYAMGEGYPGLVVHGPYQAILLVDHLLRQVPGTQIADFTFRGVRPLFANTPFSLHSPRPKGGYALWTRDAEGAVCMEASLTASRP